LGCGFGAWRDTGTMDLPPDLRVLCRTLTSVSTDDLPAICPTLVSQVLRCGKPLSSPLEKKAKDSTNEATVLVHKLKTHINTLFNGRSPQGRFAGMVLSKAVVDVGGWECLRTSDPWIQGCLSILQVRMNRS